jgi:ribosomal protein S1
VVKNLTGVRRLVDMGGIDGLLLHITDMSWDASRTRAIW